MKAELLIKCLQQYCQVDYTSIIVGDFNIPTIDLAYTTKTVPHYHAPYLILYYQSSNTLVGCVQTAVINFSQLSNSYRLPKLKLWKTWAAISDAVSNLQHEVQAVRQQCDTWPTLSTQPTGKSSESQVRRSKSVIDNKQNVSTVALYESYFH